MSSIPAENFCVLVNDQGQYSVWPERRPLPEGWRSVVAPRAREGCLEYIEANWNDMRPLSLQIAMAGADVTSGDNLAVDKTFDGPSLVQRLSTGEHEVSLLSEGKTLREAIGSGIARIRFATNTGNPIITMTVGPYIDELESYASSRRQYSLTGELSLDGVSCRCHASLDAETLHGRGRLEII